MHVIYNQLLCITTVSTVVSGKSNLIGKWTIHNNSSCWAWLYNHYALQRHITILMKTALVLLVRKTLAGYKHDLPLPVIPRNRSRLPQGLPLMDFQVEVCQSSKWRGAKPVILAKHTTLYRCTRQDSNLIQVEGYQANNN